MQITFKEIEEAVAQNIITREQGESLWRFWNKKAGQRSGFQISHLAYYVGALIVITAMGWFMSNAWDAFGGMGMFAIAAFYGCCFVLAGRHLWLKGGGVQAAGGLLIVMAVCMVPLAIFGLERALGWWPQSYPGHYLNGYEWVRGGWIWIEAGTIAGACLALRFFKFPFLTAPLFFSLYLLSIDVTPFFFGADDHWTNVRWMSLLFGFVMMVIAFFTDDYCRRNQKEDYAFWGYLFGTVVFWLGLTLLDSNQEWSKVLYCLMNVILLIVGVLLKRKIFLVCGALGVNGYIAHLAYRVFYHSVLFPFVLSFAGIGIIYIGILYNKNQSKIERSGTIL